MFKKILNIKNIAIIMIAIFFLFDRYLKYLALNSEGPRELVKNVFNFSFSKNYNIAFSLKVLSPEALTILIAIIILLLLFYLIYLSKKNYSKHLTLPLLAIILGAFSNWLDRALYLYVIDYFEVLNISILNIADIMITLGVAYLLFSTYIKKRA
ncbi:MAG: signal peptidase II [Candidatus Pacebacteria bacterium]|nr:signal peptidase II [Candidatus Paceibacterota bacterium]